MFQQFVAKTLLLASLLGVCSIGYTQTTDEWIERGVRKYNALKDWTDTISHKYNKETYMQAALNELQLIQADLEKARTGATMNQIQVIDYFDMNSIYTIGFMYGGFGESTPSISYLRQVEQRMSRFSESSFPLRYPYDGKNYVINYQNFEPTRMEFYVGFGELLISKKYYDEAKTNLEKALSFTYDSNFLRYIAYDKLMNVHQAQPFDDLVCINYASKAFYTYTRLEEETRKNLDENKFSSFFNHEEAFLTAIENQTKVLNSKITPALIDAIAAAKWWITQTDEFEDELMCELFMDACYRAVLHCGETDANTIRTVYNYFKKNDPTNTAELERALAILSAQATTCSEMRWIAGEYASLGNTVFANTVGEMATKCEEDQVKALKESERRAEEEKKQQERNYRRNNRDYFFYTGVNIFPLFGPEPDYGLAVNLGSNRFILELSGLLVNQKKENFFDLDLREIDDVQDHYWDGYFAHANFKFSDDSWNDGRGGYYAGFLFAYNERTFEPFQSTVTNVNTGTAQLVDFAPTSSQYIMMFNYGVMGARVIGMDIFFGVGAAYNTFNGNSDKYWRNPDYTIEDQMMQNRVKNYWSFTMRMGMSIGIGWGR